MTSIAVQSRYRWALAVGLVVVVGLVVIVGTRGSSPGPATATCRTGLGSVSDIQRAIAKARPGSTVCVRAGAYGAITLTRNSAGSKAVILRPADEADANSGGRVTFAGITIAGSRITVRDVYSTGGIAIAGSGVYQDDTIDHDDVTNPRGYGISILCAFADPCRHITISGNRVHGTCATCEGDGIRLDGWRDVRIVGNDIYGIHACPGCHTDTLQSYESGQPTSGLTVAKNYVHDSFQSQGLPFLKDGDIADVRIEDNLSVRMTSNGQTTGPGIDESTNGLILTRNTYVGGDGYVQGSGTGSPPMARIDHNVFGAFNVQAPFYTLIEDHNLYTGNNEWSFRIGAHSRLDAHPSFLCGHRCGGGSAAGDDYRLVGHDDPKSTNYGVGIDWSPAEQHYGPW
jgi:hypothetical protein